MSPQTLAEIQRRWLLGETVPALARDYGVPRRRIRRIVAASTAQEREHGDD